MIRVHIAHILLFVATLCGVGCTSSSEALATIDRVLESAEAEPEAALELIRSVNRERLRGDYDRARYALAYSEALYYNRICCDRDTLVTPMMRYYIHDNEHHDERARALYQHALVMQRIDNNPKAIYSLTEADKSLDIAQDYKLRGLIYRTMGDIYGEEYLYKNAFEFHAQAKECFEQAKLDTHSIYSTQDMGWVALQMNEFHQADSLLHAVKIYALDNDDQFLLRSTIDLLIHLNISAYLDNNEPIYIKKSKDNLSLLDSLQLRDIDRINYYRAMVAAFDNDKERALYYIQNSLHDKLEDKAYVYWANYIVYSYLNNSKEALYYLDKLCDIEDEHISDALNTPIINHQLDILSKDIELERQININNRTYYVMAIFIITITFIIVALTYVYRYRHQKNEIEKYILTISSLKSEMCENYAAQNQAIFNIYADRFNELNKLCDTYYEYLESPKLQSIIFKQLHNTIEAIKSDQSYFNSLVQTLNINQDNIVNKLDEHCPTLTPRERRITIYSYAGFSLRAISIFMDSQPIVISKAKYKIKVKIKNSHTQYSDILISKL